MKKFRIVFYSISKGSKYYFKESVLFFTAENQLEALKKFFASVDCIHGLFLKEIKECSNED